MFAVPVRIVVAAILCLLLLPTEAQEQPRQRVLVCLLSRNHVVLSRMYSLQLYQLQKYAKAFPGIQFDWKLLYNAENSDTTSMLRSIVANGTDCNAFLGPQSSTLALGTGPLITAPQVDSASGSPELSDDKRFPFYNRVNAVQAANKVLSQTILHFGWNLVNILCTDESLGRAASQTISESFANTTTRIGTQFCVSSNPTRREVSAALEAVSAKSRIIVLAVNHVSAAWGGPDGVLEQIQEMKLHRTHVLFVPPGQPCRETAGLEYALCVDGLLDEEAFGPVMEDYAQNVNVSEHTEAFLEAGVSVENVAVEPWSHLLSHLAYDGVTFFMRAYAAHQAKNASGFDPTDYPSMVSALRSYSMQDGVTGVIQLDGSGDRETQNLYNVYSMGNASDDRTVILNNRNNTINEVSESPIVWFDGTTNIPMADILVDDASEETGLLFIYIFVPVISVLLVVIACVYIQMKRRSRKLSCAPTKGSLALAFTDIESSTQLWRADAVGMSKALNMHNIIIRRNIRKHQGYEVKTVGDAFMIATRTGEQMVRIAVDTQRDLRDYSAWPEKIRMRIRFGIHVGTPEVVFDKISKGYDYFGNDVNQAARIESKCEGRQILISTSSLDSAQITALEKELDVKWVEGRLCNLKGIDSPVELRQITYDPMIHYSDPFESSESQAYKLDESAHSTASTTLSSELSYILVHPSNLNVRSSFLKDLDLDDEPLQELYVAVLEGFFLTAQSSGDTKSRFEWLARAMMTECKANEDGAKLRLLAQRLEQVVDNRAVERACKRIARNHGNVRKKRGSAIRASATSEQLSNSVVDALGGTEHSEEQHQDSHVSDEATPLGSSDETKEHIEC